MDALATTIAFRMINSLLRRYRISALAILTTWAFVACSPTEGCDVCSVSVVLQGAVKSVTGDPIPGATILIRNLNKNCAPGSIIGTATAHSDADGKFTTGYTAPYLDGCLRLSVSASGFAPDSVSWRKVPFREFPPLDSLTTTFYLVPK